MKISAGNPVISRHCEVPWAEAIQLNYLFRYYHCDVYFFWIASPPARNDGLSIANVKYLDKIYLASFLLQPRGYYFGILDCFALQAHLSELLF
jgi:hypothetical protein